MEDAPEGHGEADCARTPGMEPCLDAAGVLAAARTLRSPRSRFYVAGHCERLGWFGMSAQTAFLLFLLVVLLAFLVAFKGPGKRSEDQIITATVVEAFAKEFAFSTVSIDVKTFDGVVVLGGFVREFDQAKRAVEIAGGIKGVKSIDNRMSVRSGQ